MADNKRRCGCYPRRKTILSRHLSDHVLCSKKKRKKINLENLKKCKKCSRWTMRDSRENEALLKWRGQGRKHKFCTLFWKKELFPWPKRRVLNYSGTKNSQLYGYYGWVEFCAGSRRESSVFSSSNTVKELMRRGKLLFHPFPFSSFFSGDEQETW